MECFSFFITQASSFVHALPWPRLTYIISILRQAFFQVIIIVWLAYELMSNVDKETYFHSLDLTTW